MPTSDYFSASYGEARQKFVAAGSAAGARLCSYPLGEQQGPAGEPLVIDVAVLGAAQPESVLLLISGTHGVEGFCGSGCQVGYLADGLHDALPAGCGALLIHALNPYGFAWLRRVNEDNIDLNRNGLDFHQPPPDSSAYEGLHDALLPQEWDGPSRQRADAVLDAFIREQGLAAYQAVLQRGQYSRPNGLFYGGNEACWSLRTLEQILAEQLSPAISNLAVIDLHTGLGPWGYGEPIWSGAGAAGFQRARQWYGPEVTNPLQGSSQSAVVCGSLPELFRRLVPATEITDLALEFGTLPIAQELGALRADNWLHAVPQRITPHREGIRRQMRDTFYIDTPAWKAAVYGRTADFVLRASRALAPSAV